MFRRLIEDFGGMMTVIGPVGSSVAVIRLSKNEDVVPTTERVFENGGRAEINIRIMAWSLIGGGTIKVPSAKLANISDLLADCLLKENYCLKHY